MQENTAAKHRPVIRDGAYAWAVVVMLTLAYTVSFIDRQVLNLLVDPIKTDLGATDTQMSLLQGAAFIFAYIAFNPLFGRWVDTGHRRNILIIGIALWSAFTVLCGLSENLTTLFIGRAGVGAAEAALGPAAWSLISDYFTRSKLPRAMSVYLMGPYIGGGAALIFGGVVLGGAANLTGFFPFLEGLAPWQITFIAAGVPGLALCLLFLLVREPERMKLTGVASDDRQFSLKEATSFLWDRRNFYVRFFLTMALIVVVLYAVPAWGPAMLIRSYGVTAENVGLVFGLMVLGSGSAGVLSGPVLGNWLLRRGHKSAIVLCAVIAAVCLVVICALFPFAPNYHSGLFLLGAATFFFSFPQAMAASALQIATPNRMRGVVIATYTLVLSGIGLGLAPTIVAMITDFVFSDPAHVRESLAIVCSVSALCAALLGWSTLPHYRRALEQEERDQDQAAHQAA